MQNIGEAWSVLLQMREAFVHDLPLRIQKLEQYILTLQSPHDAEEFKTSFADLLRETHSLKGIGGSFGLPFITAVCHHLEEAYRKVDSEQASLPPTLANYFLEYIDILNDTVTILESESGFGSLEQRLHALKQKRVNGFSGLLLTASRSTYQLCQSITSEHNAVEWRRMDDAYEALGVLLQEHFDLIVCSHELARLSGEAFIAALRLSPGVNRHTPILLVSSSDASPLPRHIGADYVLHRDQEFVSNLSNALAQLIKQLAA